ncbi:hypothetical protein CFOL_v3_16764, partial [Cephalotus follicularis]
IIFYTSITSCLPPFTAMEDWNTLAADCVVLSCCCQCLILQILTFVAISLPCKLFRKAKDYIEKRRQKREEQIRPKGRFQEEFVEFHGEEEEFSIEGNGCGCLEEVEMVLKEFSQKGEFAFGSFWGMERTEDSSTSVVAKHDVDFSVVQYEFIEMIGPFSLV